ncbi:hypothetical protein BDP55DRAFT_630880 [Colletotrichum godetiae]|uniref:Uncharacterized protein n=1 Tax=Colletotrichum godetiae TaxID=1209918 RepID=A0AAJ0EV15_9PEZI|nr:uncharacterized protein BDP55DRAFT_630880 [Colletotrichum godetiae]KAK1676792.1 hypothetical protein BDP55DRAFT_630880 [Colletotrichum godetiae]
MSNSGNLQDVGKLSLRWWLADHCALSQFHDPALCRKRKIAKLGEFRGLWPEAELLLWPAPGSLRDIAVLDTAGLPAEAFVRRQPFASSGPGDEPMSFHPIVSLSAVYHLVSRLTIGVNNLEALQDTCCRMAEEHEIDRDDDTDEDEETDEYCICQSCKEHPSRYYKNTSKLHVEAKAKPYVTTGDVVLVIWDDIRLADIMTNENWADQYPLAPANTKAWLNGDSSCSSVYLIRQAPDDAGNQEDRDTHWREVAAGVLKSKRNLCHKAVDTQ